MKTIEIINKFIESKGYYDFGVLGIVFYGSRKYNTARDNSDIDLLIITDRNNNYKGVAYIDGVRVEYFEKGYGYLLDKVESQALSPDRSMEAIFKNGEIIYSEDYLVESLRDEVLSTNRIVSKRKGNYFNVNDWKDVFNRVSGDNNFSKYVYHNLIENIRKVYHDKNGFDDISSFKTQQMYSDPEYSMKYYCLRLPSSSFRSLFTSAMEEGFNREKVDSLMKLIGDEDSSRFGHINDYCQKQLEYKSTIVAGNIDRVVTAINEENSAANHYYYLALDKVRRLYCDINGIDSRVSKFGEGYSEEFLGLFNKCLDSDDKASDIKEMFSFVTEPLKMDYQEYKVLEYTN